MLAGISVFGGINVAPCKPAKKFAERPSVLDGLQDRQEAAAAE
jgi:hypothetical protein